uniref:Protein kinase domain-containing protein n=1 Tax=Arcella intermedia TaxID=1963864 RepID=A0A6B2L3S5_9EUKA
MSSTSIALINGHTSPRSPLRRERTDGQAPTPMTEVKVKHTRTLSITSKNESGDSDLVKFKSSAEKLNFSSNDNELSRWLINLEDLKIIDPPIGGGYFGEVKLGYWRGIKVACKFVYEKSFRNKSDIELFDQEVSILSSLRHPNVILYMGVCLDKDKIIVMEYMENGSLSELLKKKELRSHQIHKIATEIALGMNYLHGENILHRDLTSKNILLSKHMEAKVADFGLSKVKLAESHTYSYTMGSIAWMAPEVIANASKFSKSSDVYSYGIILWEIWTGCDPCPKEIAIVNLANKVLHEQYRPTIPPTVHAKWQDLIRSCWESDPDQRPSFDKILGTLDQIPAKLKKLPTTNTYPQHITDRQNHHRGRLTHPTPLPHIGSESPVYGGYEELLGADRSENEG